MASCAFPAPRSAGRRRCGARASSAGGETSLLATSRSDSAQMHTGDRCADGIGPAWHVHRQPTRVDNGWPYGLHSASPNGRQIAGLPATVRADGMRWERTGAAVYADMRYCSDPYSTSYSPSTDLGPSTPSRSRLVTVVLQSGAHGRTASAPSASVRESAASFDGLKESRWMEWQSVARRACERLLTSCVPSGVPARFPAAKRALQGRV